MTSIWEIKRALGRSWNRFLFKRCSFCWCPSSSGATFSPQDCAPVFHPWVPGCHSPSSRSNVGQMWLSLLCCNVCRTDRDTSLDTSDVPMIYTQEIAVFLQKGVNFFKQNLLTQLMSEGVLCYVEQLWDHMKYPLILQPMKADDISYGKSEGNPKRSPSQLCEVYIRPKVTVDVTKCLPYGWLIIYSPLMNHQCLGVTMTSTIVAQRRLWHEQHFM